MIVENVVRLTEQSTSSAIQVGQSLQDDSLLSGYAMTDSAAKVFNHIAEAVLPQATPDQRAINIYGSYGSGKSHLAVVLSRLLRDGATDKGFDSLISRLKNSSTKFGSLGDKLTDTFLGRADKDAHPYFVLNLYAVEAPSISEQLIGALVSELERHPEIDAAEILPTTQHEVCLQRIKEIETFSTYEEKDFFSLGITDSTYFNLVELKSALEECEPDSLDAFQTWHKAVTMGQVFDPLKNGGADLLEVYLHAGQKLANLHGYAGILVIWDEFGSCLEDLYFNSDRNLLEEVSQLQRFVESACAPASGHTIFVGVSHVTFQEYSQRLGFEPGNTVDAAFEKIAGRFNGNHPFGIRLSAGEEEGYHLIGMQREWTEQGKVLREKSQANKQQLIKACRSLESFNRLSRGLETLVDEVYPLHPTTALTLFNLSKLSQASRTALSFLKLHKDAIFTREVGTSIWSTELVRVDAIVDYFSEELASKSEYKSAYENYLKSVNSLVGSPEDIKQQSQILSLLFLASVLGEALKPTEEFLSCALYDTTSSIILTSHLESLRKLGVVWQNDVNKFWQLAGDSSLNIDQMILDKIKEFPHRARSVYDILVYQPDMRETFLPALGEFVLATNEAGIIHSYDVSMVKFDDKSLLKPSKTNSATVKLVFTDSDSSNLEIESSIASQTPDELYFWLPKNSLNVASKYVDDHKKNYLLKEVLSSYWACSEILSGDSVKGSARIQLETKSEFLRGLAKELFLEAFGAAGLRSGNTKILKAGATEKVEVNSWVALNRSIIKGLKTKYDHPISVRAANVNILSATKPYKLKTLSDIVERILSFDQNSSYQTKYLGKAENSQGLCTSEDGAIINGVISCNGLIKPAIEGHRLAKLEELKDSTGKFVSDLRKELTTKKQDGINVFDIASKYNRAPFGVPRTVLPIFMAFAVKDILSSLKWSGYPTMNSKDFAKKLSEECFKQSNTLRFAEFNPIQKMFLSEAAKVYGISYSKNSRGMLTSESYEEIAKALVSELRKVPESALANSDVSNQIKNFIKNISKVGISNHETVIELSKVLEVRSNDDSGVVHGKLVSFKEIFERANEEVLYKIKDKVNLFTPMKSDEVKWKFISSLSMPLAKLVVSYTNLADRDIVSLKRLVESELKISFIKLTDMELQRTITGLDTLFELASNPPVATMPEPPSDFPAITEPAQAPVSVVPEPDVADERKRELSEMVNMIWPLIQSNNLKPQTVDEVEFFIHQLRVKGIEVNGS